MALVCVFLDEFDEFDIVVGANYERTLWQANSRGIYEYGFSSSAPC